MPVPAVATPKFGLEPPMVQPVKSPVSNPGFVRRLASACPFPRPKKQGPTISPMLHSFNAMPDRIVFLSNRLSHSQCVLESASVFRSVTWVNPAKRPKRSIPKNDSILPRAICFFTPETCESTPTTLLVRLQSLAIQHMRCAICRTDVCQRRRLALLRKRLGRPLALRLHLSSRPPRRSALRYRHRSCSAPPS